MNPGWLKIERSFIMKGASNRYGNTRGSGGQGKPSTHINYQWAKYFNKNTLDTHFDKHGKSMGFSSKTEYEQHAIKFANTVDKKNCVSFIDKNGSTYKYNKKTNELAIINKDGTVITYFKPKGGYDYYKQQKKEKVQ